MFRWAMFASMIVCWVAMGSPLLAEDQPTVIEDPIRVEPAEAKDFPAAPPGGANFQTGNLIDPATGKFLATDDEIKKVRDLAKTINTTRAEDRRRLAKEYVAIFGEARARKIGFILYDAQGKPEYYWPARTKK